MTRSPIRRFACAVNQVARKALLKQAAPAAQCASGLDVAGGARGATEWMLPAWRGSLECSSPSPRYLARWRGRGHR